MRSAQRVLEGAVAAALAGHVIATMFENSPDARVSLGTRSRYFRRLPQWRFFGPTPDTDDTHLMVRTRRSSSTGDWHKIPTSSPITWSSGIINPKTRAPKTLFDCAQQMQQMRGGGLSWAFAMDNPAYAALRQMASVRARELGGDAFQFMIVSTTPGDETLRPVVVSEWMSLD